MDRKQFKKLQQKWYKKLEADGFKDIENTSDPDQPLTHFDCAYFQTKHNPLDFELRQRYYELASQLLHDFNFRNRIDKKIWKLHSEGVRASDISKKVKLSYNQVIYIIKKYAVYIKYNSN